MTHDEETLLRAYVVDTGELAGPDDDPGFEVWYSRRHGGPEGEADYKHTLEPAQVWRDRYDAGYAAGLKATGPVKVSPNPPREGVWLAS